MKTLNDYKIIGIDHGYGNMKTANCCFPTGVIVSDAEPPFTNNLLIWNNKYYSIGVGHKEFTADKFTDEDYYILTLAAIARELNRERITDAKVFIAAGLPLTWVVERKNEDRFLDRVTATIQDNLKALTPLLNLLTLTQPVAQPQQAVTVSEKKDSAAEENMLEFLDSF